MAVYRRGKIWWYKFNWNGETVRESTKQSNKRVAEQMEAAKRTALAKAEVGIKKRERAPKLTEFAPKFTAAIETTCAEKPATVSFYKAKLKVLVKHLGNRRLDEIEEAASVNRELATLRRLLRLAQEWKVLNRVPRIHLLRGEQQREFVLSHPTGEAIPGCGGSPRRFAGCCDGPD